ncbi:MAG: hypothetical protein JWN85_143 [Gammaproteobacteria bacterium]|nr:hypothetical protein [Gammaproteobacteria bacterium]
MTVVRARTRSGARSGLRSVMCGFTAVLALLATACGNSTIDLGTPVITLTDTSGDFTSYIVTVTSIILTRSDGNIVQPLSSLQRVDLTQLAGVVELLEAPAIATGTYVSATMTIDYSTSEITVNQNGHSAPVTLVDSAGAVPTTKTFTVKFDPANPLVITKGKSSLAALDIDLAASNSINFTTSPATVTVMPFMTANAKPVYDTPIHARGLFVDADTTANTFSMNLRPLHDVTGILLGALHVQTGPSTYFNVNGVTYTGPAGLAAVAALRENTQIAAVGSSTAVTDLTGVTPIFTATAVYAGTSLESTIADHVSGVVAARTGNTLTVRDALMVDRLSDVTFSDSVTVAMGGSTVVSEDGVATAPLLNTAAVSVGQHIDVSGQVTTDSTLHPVSLDAAAGQVRLQPTTLWGALNSVGNGGISVSLLSIDNLEPAQFNFSGTSSTGLDATPSTYAVNTGSINVSSLAVSGLLKIDGFANAFGSAPPDFNATAVTPDTSAQSQVIVEWGNGGTTAPFISQSATGILIDPSNPNLAGTVHVIRTGPRAVDITPLLQAGLTISTSNATVVNQNAIVLAIGNLTNGISSFNTAAAFSTQVGTTLNGTNKVNKLVAVGIYDPTGNTFNASSIDINVQ